jgi:hypothetical protein
MIKAARVSLLILVLTCSAQAGYIPNGTAQPTPTPAPEPIFFVEEEPEESDAPSDVTQALAEITLSVLNNMLALL